MPETRVNMPYVLSGAENLIACILSMLATSFVIGKSMCNIKKLQYISKMVLFVMTADFSFCLSKIILYINQIKGIGSINTCKALQVYSQCSLLQSVIWSTLFGHTFYAVVKYERPEITEKYYKCYIFISSLFAVLGFATVFTNYVTYLEDGVCGHVVTVGSPDITFIVFDVIPIMGCCLLGLIFYILGACELRKKTINFGAGNFLTLALYPGIMMICAVPTLATGILACFGFKVRITSLTFNLSLLQGFLDAFVYWLLPQIREKMRRTITRSQLDTESIYESEIEIQEAIIQKQSDFGPNRIINNEDWLQRAKTFNY